jgi:prepilin-type N-terminal cleavage/methylation domain-containing protein
MDSIAHARYFGRGYGSNRMPVISRGPHNMKSGVLPCTLFALYSNDIVGEVPIHMRSKWGEVERHRFSAKGFSLLELLITMAIAGILAGLAVPSMAKFLNNYRLETAARTVWTDVQSARMAAIKGNQSVELQTSSTTSYTYIYVDGNNVTHSFFRNLADDCPGATVSLSGSTPVTFPGAGMRAPGANTKITVQNSSGTREFWVTWTGRIGGIATP